MTTYNIAKHEYVMYKLSQLLCVALYFHRNSLLYLGTFYPSCIILCMFTQLLYSV
jgi:hypothetical protein